MTPNEFRKIALGFSGTVEAEHMDHPDFRYKGKIFATLGYPDDGWGMFKLTPAQQHRFIDKAPGVFALSSGAWGRAGSTIVRLESADKRLVKAALQAAFQNIDALKKVPNHSRDRTLSSGTSLAGLGRRLRKGAGSRRITKDVT